MASTVPEAVNNKQEEEVIEPQDSGDDSDRSTIDPNEDMPTLEEVQKELDQLAPEMAGKKNIVIPEDNADDEDDEDEDAGGYVDILNNKDLRKKVIKPGNGQRPTRGAKVAIRLVTRLYTPEKDGEAAEDAADVGSGRIIREETFDRFIVNIGDSDLHQGLDLVLPLMEEKETARAIIKPRFAYGPNGNRSVGVPETTPLDLEIELLEILDRPDELAGYGGEEESGVADKEPLAERHRAGTYKKDRGNFWFQRGDYSTAIQCYRGAIKYLDLSEEELKKLDKARKRDKQDDQVKSLDQLIEKRAQTFNNLAAAQMKLLAFDMAGRSLEESLLLRPNNPKALFRRAKIHQEHGELEKAIDDLKRALELNPSSEAIVMELEKMNRLLNKQLLEQRQLYRRMMQPSGVKKCKNPFPGGNKVGDQDEDDRSGDSEVLSTGAKLKHWASRFGLPAAGVLVAVLAMQTIYMGLMK